MKTESDYEYLVRRLKESRGLYGVISRATGVPYFTVVKVAREVVSPRESTMRPLLAYFRAEDAGAPKTKKKADTRVPQQLRG